MESGGGFYGATVAHNAFLRSVLVHGHADEYVIFTRDPALAARDLGMLAGAEHQRIQLRPITQLPTALAEGGGDLLVSTMSQLYPLAHLRRRYARHPVPICNTVVSALSYQGLLPLYMGDVWSALFPYDCLVFFSQACRNAWQVLINGIAAGVQRPVPVARQEVIPPGVDTNRYQPRDRAQSRALLGLPADGVLVLSLSRLSPYDKMDLMPVLTAFERQIARRPDLAFLHLVIAGADRPFGYSEEVSRFVAVRGLQERIRILPDPDEATVASLYNACDIFIAPYDCLQENFGQTLLEAMASGLPVVASDWGPFRETILPGETGILIPTCWAPCVQTVGDLAPILTVPMEQLYLGQSVAVDMTALWQAVIDLAQQPQQRVRMAERARQQALAFDWMVIIARYEQLWQVLVQDVTQRPSVPAAPGAPYFSDYFAAYHHYPQTVLDERTEVQLTALGQEILSHRNHLAPPALIRPVLSQALLTALASNCRDWMPVGSLLAGQTDPLEVQYRMYHILWLIKYGILEYRQPPRLGLE